MQNGARIEYDYSIAKAFTFATILFGIIGMTVGVIIAFQLAFPSLSNLAGEYGTFSRLRPLHTNGVAFGFTLSGIFATWYYVGQRVLKMSLKESKFIKSIATLHFVLYFILILLAVVTLLMGYTSSKEYAELEWPLDVLVVVVWVLFGIAMFGMIGLRRERTLYISVWYYIACFVAIAMLYLFNNMEVPTFLFANGAPSSFMNSISAYAGTNDALVQWWYGHNAVAFVFTTPIIAMIYYFLPKESGQNVYSYKLSILAFWGLMFVYLWAGGHHLLYSTVPDWMQTMGSTMSVVLILPSWGSAINMLLTMKGEWGQLQTNPLIKFLVLASTFYMLSTIEGPIQAIKSVNAIAHFTDWIPGHVHDGVLGWVAFMIIASLFHMAPRMYKRELYSKSLIETQFWLQTVGIVFYFTSMWIAGITQGMMWRAYDQYGSLVYSFIDTVEVLHPYYTLRAVGGLLFLTGFFMFAYNMYKTATCGRVLDKEPANASPMGA
jgi:cytochrome c oxidase cbb3-type subunit 1